MKTNKYIKELSGAKEVECSCDTCKSMCKTCPCIGTPYDIGRLVDAGYKDKLANTTLASDFVMQTFGKPVEIIGLKFDEKTGHCVMLDEKGLCKLHNLDLKPLEGRTASCNKNNMVSNSKIYTQICVEWLEFMPNFNMLKNGK